MSWCKKSPRRRTEVRIGKSGVSVRTPVKDLLAGLAEHVPVFVRRTRKPCGNVIGRVRSLCVKADVFLRPAPEPTEKRHVPQGFPMFRSAKQRRSETSYMPLRAGPVG